MVLVAVGWMGPIFFTPAIWLLQKIQGKTSQTHIIVDCSCKTHHTRKLPEETFLNHKFCFSVVSPLPQKKNKETHEPTKHPAKRPRRKGTQRRLGVIGPVTPCRTGQAILEEHASVFLGGFSLTPNPHREVQKRRTPVKFICGISALVAQSRISFFLNIFSVKLPVISFI